MKRLFLLPVLFISLTGCFRHQFFSMTSPQLQTTDSGLIMENDTLRITYCLTGSTDRRNTMVVQVYNKSYLPISIDWSRSAFICHKQKIAIYQPVSTLYGTLQATTVETRFADYSSGTFSGEITHSEATSFIPPGSQVISPQASIPVHPLQTSEKLPAVVVPASWQNERQNASKHLLLKTQHWPSAAT